MNLVAAIELPVIPAKKIKSLRNWYLSIFAIILFVFSLYALRAMANPSSENSVLLTLANQDRISNGLTPLNSNPLLQKAALAKANDMLDKQYFEHISPEGRTPWEFIKEAGYNFSYAGENLAMDFNDMEKTHTAWMNSPTHGANVLDSNYSEMGTATISGQMNGHQTIITVEMFGSSPVNSTINRLKTIWEK